MFCFLRGGEGACVSVGELAMVQNGRENQRDIPWPTGPIFFLGPMVGE